MCHTSIAACRQYFFLLVTLFSFNLIPSITQAHPVIEDMDEVPSVRQAIFLVEEQKILSQKMSKAFVALTINNKVSKFYQEIDSSRVLFEHYMKRLESFASNTPLESSTANLRNAWDQFKEQSNKEIDIEEAKLLLTLNDELFAKIIDLTSAAQAYSKDLLPDIKNSLDAIDLLNQKACNQNVLIQEYLLYFFTKKAAIPFRGVNKRFKTVEKEIKSNLEELMAAAENSAEVDQQLYLVNTQWNEVLNHLKKWNPNSEAYMSSLHLYSSWTQEKISGLSHQYQEIAEIMSISHLINLASSHRAQSQEMAKQYISMAFQLGNVAAEKRELLNNIENFEARMTHLYLFAPSEAIKLSTQTIKGFWKNYKRILTSAYNENNIFKLLEQSYIIMAACDKLAEQIESYAEQIKGFDKLQEDYGFDGKIGHFVNLSGRQCMDLQRIPIYFLLLSKEMDGSMTERRFREAKLQFIHTLEILKDASVNTSEIESLLVEIEDLWNPLLSAITSKGNKKDDDQLAEILDKARNIYQKMLKTSQLYAAEMNNLIERKLRK